MVATATIPDVARVGRLWPNSTIVCLGTGPSLCQEDVDCCRGRAKVIAIKDAIQLAPWADVLYGAGSDGSQWWQRPSNKSWVDGFNGLKFSLDRQARACSTVLKNGSMTGLSSDPTRLALGKNSGYQAIGLAVLLGASRIVLLGFDMKPDADDRDHFFGQHVRGNRVPFSNFLPLFETMVEPLKALGVTVVNCSPETALDTFPRMTLTEALA